MRKIKLAFNTQGGELDSKTVEVADDYDLNDQGVITQALIDWLHDDFHILDVGDTISITEIE